MVHFQPEYDVDKLTPFEKRLFHETAKLKKLLQYKKKGDEKLTDTEILLSGSTFNQMMNTKLQLQSRFIHLYGKGDPLLSEKLEKDEPLLSKKLESIGLYDYKMHIIAMAVLNEVIRRTVANLDRVMGELEKEGARPYSFRKVTAVIKRLKAIKERQDAILGNFRKILRQIDGKVLDKEELRNSLRKHIKRLNGGEKSIKSSAEELRVLIGGQKYDKDGKLLKNDKGGAARDDKTRIPSTIEKEIIDYDFLFVFSWLLGDLSERNIIKANEQDYKRLKRLVIEKDRALLGLWDKWIWATRNKIDYLTLIEAVKIYKDFCWQYKDLEEEVEKVDKKIPPQPPLQTMIADIDNDYIDKKDFERGLRDKKYFNLMYKCALDKLQIEYEKEWKILTADASKTFGLSNLMFKAQELAKELLNYDTKGFGDYYKKDPSYMFLYLVSRYINEKEYSIKEIEKRISGARIRMSRDKMRMLKLMYMSNVALTMSELMRFLDLRSPQVSSLLHGGNRIGTVNLCFIRKRYFGKDYGRGKKPGKVAFFFHTLYGEDQKINERIRNVKTRKLACDAERNFYVGFEKKAEENEEHEEDEKEEGKYL